MRLIVRGPLKYDDYDFVKRMLNKITKKAKDVILVSDMRPDEEFSVDPSYFPLGERWIQDRWKANAVRGGDKKRFSRMIRYCSMEDGNKKWSREEIRKRRMAMIRDATCLVAFWDVGGDDDETEAMVKLARIYDLQLRVVRI